MLELGKEYSKMDKYIYIYGVKGVLKLCDWVFIYGVNSKKIMII